MAPKICRIGRRRNDNSSGGLARVAVIDAMKSVYPMLRGTIRTASRAMGSLPQMHRDEQTISEVVQKLMKHGHSICYGHSICFELKNVPNVYLNGHH